MKTEIINLYHSSKRPFSQRNNHMLTNMTNYNFFGFTTRNTFTDETTYNTNNATNNNNDYQDSKSTIRGHIHLNKNSKYFEKFYDNSISKKELFKNFKCISPRLLVNIKKRTNVKNRLFLQRTLSKEKAFNLKKIKINDNIIPLISNYNFRLKLLKNIKSTNSLPQKTTIAKPKSLKNIISYRSNFFNDYGKDFFPNLNYSNLEYNERLIYRSKAVYDKFIKEKVNYFRNNKIENFTTELEKTFYYGKNKKQINLTLSSLKITLEDMSLPPELQDKNLKIDFPFSLLPIFYYKGSDSFQKFLAIVIKIENNFETIIFDNNKICLALNMLNDFKINQNNEYKRNSIDSNMDEEYLLFKETKKAKRVDSTPITLKPKNLQKSQNFLRYNNFIFFWITNTRNFVTKLTLPNITLNIPQYNITIKHFLDFELLFYLYKRDFKNWEYFIIRHLSSYAKFRIIFQQLGSQTKYRDKTIFLKEPKTKINTFAEEILFNIYTDQFNKNNIILFKSFYVIVNLIDANYLYEKIYNIYFSFQQYIKLYDIAKYSPKLEFLIKFLEINNDTHTLNFNFKEYDEFDSATWMNNIKSFSEKSLIDNNIYKEKLYGVFDIYTKRIKIEFKKPQWTIIKFEDGKEISKTWEIGKELEKSLVLSILYGNSKNWTNLLNSCLEKLNEPVPRFPKSRVVLTKKRTIRGQRKPSDSNQSSTYKKTRFSTSKV